MRSFIAIDCDENLKKNISLLLNQLDNGTGNVRWIQKQGMHLTLKFLGEIEDRQLEAIEQEIKNSLRAFRPFDLNLRGTGIFPPSRFPRVLWVGVEENEAIHSLQRAIERSLVKLGFPKEKRRYRPHLTLGRVKRHDGLESVLDVISKKSEEYPL